MLKSSKPTAPLLKLVVSNPDPFQETSPSQVTDSNRRIPPSFTVDVRVKGSCLYEMTVHDPSHYLKCDFILEVEEAQDVIDPGSVICYFSTISDEALNDFIEEDETLYGAIMIQFQMKILEQLLLFCATHDASTLVIFADDAQADVLDVYQDFLVYKDQTLTHKGKKTEMIIPADCETFDIWVDFMEKMTTNFRQILWRDQRSNPVIRQYLKTHSLG